MNYAKILAISITLIGVTITIFDTAFARDLIDDKEKEEINKLIEAYIMEHPEVIIKSIDEMRKRQQREEQEAAKKNLIAFEDEILRNPSDPVGGNKEGDVTVVEFFDYRCGYCKQFYNALNEVSEEDENVRIVFKELPVLGPTSELAARAAIAASRQNLYQPFHEKLMELEGNFDDKKLFDVAGEVGLDIARLKKDMALRSVQGILDDTKDLAQNLSITGTPAIIIGSNIIRGAIGKDRLKALIAATRK